MDVIGLVGELVVVPMMGGPPEDSLLTRGPAEEGQDELERPAGFERAVRKIAMESGGDAEHANGQQCRSQGDGAPSGGLPNERSENQQAGGV